MKGKIDFPKGLKPKISIERLGPAVAFGLVFIFFIGLKIILINLFNSYNALGEDFYEYMLQLTNMFSELIQGINNNYISSSSLSLAVFIPILALYIMLILVVMEINILLYIFFINMLGTIAASFGNFYKRINFLFISFLLIAILLYNLNTYKNLTNYLEIFILVISIPIFVINSIFDKSIIIGKIDVDNYKINLPKHKKLAIDTERLELAGIFGICFIIFYYLDYYLNTLVLFLTNSFHDKGPLGTVLSIIIGLIYLFSSIPFLLTSCFFLIYSLGLIAASFGKTIRRVLFLFFTFILLSMLLTNMHETELSPLDLLSSLLLIIGIFIFIANFILNRSFLIGEISGYHSGCDDTKFDWYLKGFAHMFRCIKGFLRHPSEMYLVELLSFFERTEHPEPSPKSKEEGGIKVSKPIFIKFTKKSVGIIFITMGIMLDSYLILNRYLSFEITTNKNFICILYLLISVFLIATGSNFINTKKFLIPIQFFLCFLTINISNTLISHVFSNGNNLELIMNIKEKANSYFVFVSLLAMLILIMGLIGYIYYNKYITILLLLSMFYSVLNYYLIRSISHEFDLLKILYLLISFGLSGYFTGLSFFVTKGLIKKLFGIILVFIIFIFLVFMESAWYLAGFGCITWSIMIAASLSNPHISNDSDLQ